jgi:hypothetical protein
LELENKEITKAMPLIRLTINGKETLAPAGNFLVRMNFMKK